MDATFWLCQGCPDLWYPSRRERYYTYNQNRYTKNWRVTQRQTSLPGLFTSPCPVEHTHLSWFPCSQITSRQEDRHHLCTDKEKVASCFLLLIQGLMMFPRMASNFIIIIFQQPSEFWDYRHDSLIPFFLSATTYQFFSILEHSVRRIILNLCCNASLIQHKISDIH